MDFNNSDREGRVRLNTIGAMQSLNLSQVVLRNGLEVELECGDFFLPQGIVEYSEPEHIWVARFDPNDLRDKDDGSSPDPYLQNPHYTPSKVAGNLFGINER